MHGYWNITGDEYGGQLTYMQECAYPLDYHQAYGHMYCHPIGPEPQMEMIYPLMYPDIYYKLYPYVSQICDKMDDPYVVYPSEQLLEKMVDECYDMCVKDMPELEEYADMTLDIADDDLKAQQRRRRPLLRDLIAIILLSELFRRRRRSWIWEGGLDNYYM